MALAFDGTVVDGRLDALTDALTRYERIAITGAPRVGKTWLSGALPLDREVIHTDMWMQTPWADQPRCIIEACETLPRFIVEGVQVPRALRKGLQVDALIWLLRPGVAQSPAQVAMGKAITTVFEGIRAQLTIPILFLE